MNEIVAMSKRSHYTYSKSKADWTATVALCASERGVATFLGVRLTLMWVERNKRRDPDNIRAGAKFVLDGLVAAGILENDGWGQVKSISDEFTVGDEPGVWVTIEGVSDNE